MLQSVPVLIYRFEGQGKPTTLGLSFIKGVPMKKASANSRLLSLAAVLLLGRVSLADQVTLKNGDRVTGKIIKKESGALTFKSDVFGNITIPWDQITKLDSEELLTVVLPGGNSMNGKITTSDSRLVVTTAAGAESASLANVSAIRRRKSKAF